MCWERPKTTYKMLPKFKKHFFLDLAESGRSGQYLAGTGPEPDLKKWPDRPEPDFRSYTDETHSGLLLKEMKLKTSMLVLVFIKNQIKLSPKKLTISQNPILPKCHSPKTYISYYIFEWNIYLKLSESMLI